MVALRTPLQLVSVKVPCPASWDAMPGDGRVRFCGECGHNVYNLSDMTAVEAEGLVAQHEGRLCVRYYVKPDGSVLTADCVGSARARGQRWMAWLISSAAVLAALLGGVLALVVSRDASRALHNGPLQAILEWLNPTPPVVMGVCPPLPPPVMGEVAPGDPQPD